MNTFRKCPVCGASSGELLHTLRYPSSAGRILPQEYRICSCSKCGMVFDDFDAGPEVFARYYETAAKYALSFVGGSGGHSGADRKRFLEIFSFLKPHLPNREIAIADIGCGKGGMLDVFYSNGYRNLYAIDASPVCIDFIRENYPYKAICSSIENLPDGYHFDLVICSSIFEHFFSPADELANIRRVLASEGMLYLEVPDAGRYKDFIKKPYHYFDAEHINHFTLTSLKNLLCCNGFHPISNGTFEQEIIENSFYPFCRQLARKSSGGEKLLVQREISAGVQAYLDASKAIREKQSGILQKLPADREVFLWGLGAYGTGLLQTGMFDRFRLAGFIDRDPSLHGREVRGLKIHSPEILKKHPDCTVFIISALYAEKIREEVEKMGFTGPVFSF